MGGLWKGFSNPAILHLSFIFQQIGLEGNLGAYLFVHTWVSYASFYPEKEVYDVKARSRDTA